MKHVPRRQILLGLALAPISAWTQASALPPEVLGEVVQAKLQGEGVFSYFALTIYKAKLWTGPGFNSSTFENHSFALELEYSRSLKGEKIAERSISEMQKQGSLSAGLAKDWLAQMTQAFPNVKNGDRITGVNKPGESAVFFFNGQRRIEVRDAEFSRRFFGIWLSPKTSAAQLRQALVGGS